MDKEVYFKVYNARNRLMLVTPSKQSVIDLIEFSTETIIIDKKHFHLHAKGARFYEGFRIENIKL